MRRRAPATTRWPGGNQDAIATKSRHAATARKQVAKLQPSEDFEVRNRITLRRLFRNPNEYVPTEPPVAAFRRIKLRRRSHVVGIRIHRLALPHRRHDLRRTPAIAPVLHVDHDIVVGTQQIPGVKIDHSVGPEQRPIRPALWNHDPANIGSIHSAAGHVNGAARAALTSGPYPINLTQGESNRKRILEARCAPAGSRLEGYAAFVIHRCVLMILCPGALSATFRSVGTLSPH